MFEPSSVSPKLAASMESVPPELASRSLIIIATYNERDTLPKLFEALFAVAPDIHVLVIDDNSPDGTGNWVDEQAAKNPRIHCLHREGKLGLGSATIAGLRYGLAQEFEFLINLDADFSHDPKYLPQVLAGMNDQQGEPCKDVMIGSRYVRGGKIEGWPLSRRLISFGVNFVSRWWLGIPARDCSGAYRCYRAEKVGLLDFAGFWSMGYAFEEEILWRLHRLGSRLGETPITFVDRRAGESKVNLREMWNGFWTLIALGFANHFTRPPQG